MALDKIIHPRAAQMSADAREASFIVELIFIHLLACHPWITMDHLVYFGAEYFRETSNIFANVFNGHSHRIGVSSERPEIYHC